MKRDYVNQADNEDTQFFVGYEVEHTPAHKLKTLFVIDIQPVTEILKRANALECKAVYFGANMSFGLTDRFGWAEWEGMIKSVLDHPDSFWCTLDFDVKYSEGFIETSLTEHPNFIPMVSVKIPYIQQFNYNTIVKIDDKDFQKSNPGVWCHKMHSLMDPDKFTNWKKYKDDKIV